MYQEVTKGEDMTDKTKAIDVEEKGLTVQEPQSLDKPKQDTEFAKEAAKFLVDIIRQNNWSRKLGGQSEHIQYEGWQTAGKYYGYAVKTYDAEYIEIGNSWGFKAKAIVVNENTGIEVGSAEAYCMSDERNWMGKPKFQLASMAQTRAGSKALRQNLGFVVALAGYNPTPVEEMTGEEFNKVKAVPTPQVYGENGKASEKQINFIRNLLVQKGFTENQLLEKHAITSMAQLGKNEASQIVKKLMALPDKKRPWEKPE